MLLKGGLVATLDPPRVELADLRVADGRITERGTALAAAEGEEVVACDGALLLPGLVNAHTHLYSALARGMPGPAAPPRSFVEVLERVWWRLDRALDEEAVHLSALVGRGGGRALRHHAAHRPPLLALASSGGSLAAVQRALEEVGLRCVLCYEVTDRNGPQGRDRGLAENVGLLQRRRVGRSRAA